MRKAKIYLIIFVLIGILFSWSPSFAEEPQEHFRKGHQFYLDSKSKEAEIEFQKTLQIDPSISDAHYYLSSIYFKQSQYDQAIKQCQMALSINPTDVKSLIILGVCYKQLKLFDQAMDAFLKAISINGQSAAAHSGLGLVYCAQGNLDDAHRQYRILGKIDKELAGDLLDQIQEAEE